MVSFDVESLFTNVPIEDAVKATLHKLENDPGLADRTNLTPAQIADLLNFVLQQLAARFINLFFIRNLCFLHAHANAICRFN